MTPAQLERLKRRLRKWFGGGTRPVSWTMNPGFGEVFMWYASSDDAACPGFEIELTRGAVYVAYESRLRRPTDEKLYVDVGIHSSSVSFLRSTPAQERTFEFSGIRTRHPVHGDLPCESHASEELSLLGPTREFEIVGRPRFAELYFEPLLLTLGG